MSTCCHDHAVGRGHATTCPSYTPLRKPIGKIPGIKLDADSGGNVRARIDKSQGLNRKERQELVDLLRKNFLYQTPRPIFADNADEHPVWVDMRLLFGHQQRILALIHKAGGWVMPPEEQAKLLAKHEEKARRAHGDGVDYDFSHLSYGDLVQMHVELEGVDELAPFRKAVGEELEEYNKETE